MLQPSTLVAGPTTVSPFAPGKDVQRLVLCPEGRYRGRTRLGAMEPSPRPLALGNMASLHTAVNGQRSPGYEAKSRSLAGF